MGHWVSFTALMRNKHGASILKIMTNQRIAAVFQIFWMSSSLIRLSITVESSSFVMNWKTKGDWNVISNSITHCESVLAKRIYECALSFRQLYWWSLRVSSAGIRITFSVNCSYSFMTVVKLTSSQVYSSSSIKLLYSWMLSVHELMWWQIYKEIDITSEQRWKHKNCRRKTHNLHPKDFFLVQTDHSYPSNNGLLFRMKVNKDPD